MANADGSPLTDLAGSRVYLGTASGTYDRVIDAGTQTSISISNLHRAVTYYIAVTGYNTWGAEGVLSPEVPWRRDDENLNGIADQWEIHYFGEIGYVAPEGDEDGDGLTNLEEYIAGTDPTIPSNVPLVDYTHENGQMVVFIPTTGIAPGDPRYEGLTRFAAIEAFVPSAGLPVVQVVAEAACNGQTIAYSVPASLSGTHRFFRARMWLAPTL